MQSAVLLIDIGNTRIKAAIANDKNNIELLQPTDLFQACEAFLKKNPGARLAYVRTGKIPSEWNRLLKDHRAVELNTTIDLPVKWAYKTPATLGADRLAGACAAVTAFPGSPVLYIGLGTALTMDFVDSSGNYLGGSISPGLLMRFKALAQFTENLPELSLTVVPTELLGDTTESSIRSGVFFGLLAEISDRIHRFSAMHPDLKIVLTGGDIGLFESKLNSPIFARPNWVFEGLLAVLKYHEHS